MLFKKIILFLTIFYALMNNSDVNANSNYSHYFSTDFVTNAVDKICNIEYPTLADLRNFLEWNKNLVKTYRKLIKENEQLIRGNAQFIPTKYKLIGFAGGAIATASILYLWNSKSKDKK